jgi:hypothetical protein
MDISGQNGGGMPGASSGTPPSAGASGGSKHGAFPPPAAAPVVVVSPPAQASGSSSTPAGLTAAVEENAVDNKGSTDSVWWYGDEDGVHFKPNGSVTNYVPPHPIYVILSILLGLLELGFHWSWVPLLLLTLDPSRIIHHQIQAPRLTQLSSLLVLCQCCSRLSLLRPLVQLFIWLWQIPELLIICYLIALPSSPTSLLATVRISFVDISMMAT